MKRIGEILVDAHAITESVRDDTLAYMRANRVSFGSAILETGRIPEELLLRALSVQTSTPPAFTRDLASIPAEIIQLVPRQLAQKYVILPFRKVGRNLYVAMAHPWENKGVAEIAFITGLTAVPHVAITARLRVALEKHYGILAPARHRAFAARPEGQYEPSVTERLPEPVPPAPPAPSRAPDLSEVSLPGPLSDQWHLPLAGIDDDLVMETTPSPSNSRAMGRIGPPAAGIGVLPLPPAAFPAFSPTDLTAVLAGAERADEIGCAILDSLETRFGRAGLFVVRGERVTGWKVRPEVPSGGDQAAAHFSEPSLFSSLRNTSGFFAGPCPDTAANRRILESIGVGFPASVGVVPVALSGKTVLFLVVAEAADRAHALQVPLLRKHAELAAIGLEIVALKNRLKVL